MQLQADVATHQDAEVFDRVAIQSVLRERKQIVLIHLVYHREPIAHWAPVHPGYFALQPHLSVRKLAIQVSFIKGKYYQGFLVLTQHEYRRVLVVKLAQEDASLSWKLQYIFCQLPALKVDGKAAAHARGLLASLAQF